MLALRRKSHLSLHNPPAAYSSFIWTWRSTCWSHPDRLAMTDIRRTERIPSRWGTPCWVSPCHLTNRQIINRQGKDQVTDWVLISGYFRRGLRNAMQLPSSALQRNAIEQRRNVSGMRIADSPSVIVRPAEPGNVFGCKSTVRLLVRYASGSRYRRGILINDVKSKLRSR